MTDPNRPSDDAVKPAQTGEPVVSKPYIMPDDPEEGSNEALTKELAEARDKMLRTLAEMENLRQRTRREVADSKMYGITGFARDILDIADNLQRALDAIPAEARETADPGIKAFIEERRQEVRSVGREVRPQLPAGDVRSARPVRSVGDSGSGRAGRLHDRRARAAPGAGRGRQGWRQGGSVRACCPGAVRHQPRGLSPRR